MDKQDKRIKRQNTDLQDNIAVMVSMYAIQHHDNCCEEHSDSDSTGEKDSGEGKGVEKGLESPKKAVLKNP